MEENLHHLIPFFAKLHANPRCSPSTVLRNEHLLQDKLATLFVEDTLPRTNIAPEKWGLEDDFPFGSLCLFTTAFAVGFREDKPYCSDPKENHKQCGLSQHLH